MPLHWHHFLQEATPSKPSKASLWSLYDSTKVSAVRKRQVCPGTCHIGSNILPDKKIQSVSWRVGDVLICKGVCLACTRPWVRIPIVDHHCHPNTWEVEAGGSEISHPWLHSEFEARWIYMRLWFKIKSKSTCWINGNLSQRRESDLLARVEFKKRGMRLLSFNGRKMPHGPTKVNNQRGWI